MSEMHPLTAIERASPEGVELRNAAYEFWINRVLLDKPAIYLGHKDDLEERWVRLARAAKAWERFAK